MNDYMINFDKIVKRSGGRIDKAATMEVVDKQFEEFIAANQIDEGVLKGAIVTAISGYDKDKVNGDPKTPSIDTVAQLTCAILNTRGADLPRVKNNVLHFLHGQSEAFVASGYQATGGTFHVKRGKGGGVFIVTEAHALSEQARTKNIEGKV